MTVRHGQVVSTVSVSEINAIDDMFDLDTCILEYVSVAFC